MKNFMTIQELNNEWSLYKTLPKQITHPCELVNATPVGTSMTITNAIRSYRKTSQDTAARVDEFDWWFIRNITSSSDNPHSSHLAFESLASLCNIWLNDEHVLTTQNMYHPHHLDVSGKLKSTNTLTLHFESLDGFLKSKYPRPKWKTGLIEHQQLRRIRTSLLGRMPGWASKTPAIGALGNINLIHAEKSAPIENYILRTRLQEGLGLLTFSTLINKELSSIKLRFGQHEFNLNLASIDKIAEGQTKTLTEEFYIEKPTLWWPATHGQQEGYSCTLEVIDVNQNSYHYELGNHYFKQVSFATSSLEVSVNNKPVYVRGACWVPLGLDTCDIDRTKLENHLRLFKQAGFNMIRISGVMRYESSAFYELCDELGIMVWQDFMFANMDYPFEDEQWLNDTYEELRYQLKRLSQYACLSVFCGNSEISQQAAMLGLQTGTQTHPFFDEALKKLVKEYAPSTPYFPSTPCGGALPFHLSEGISHFYGIGAYKKDVLSSGLEKVRFSPECLGFSHVPDEYLVNELFNKSKPMCHAPIWKQGVPRDNGAGWDFEDIRDHYFRKLYDCDPVTIRSQDTEHYLNLSRFVPGEMINQAFSIWRKRNSRNHGALIWQFNDNISGAGWGIIDSNGIPKSTYYYLSRLFRPISTYIADNGLDGASAIVINETSSEVDLRVNIQVISELNVAQHNTDLNLKLCAGETWEENIDSLIGAFIDSNFSYQFGQAQHKVICVNTFKQDSQELLSDAHYFTSNLRLSKLQATDISIEICPDSEPTRLIITSAHFLQGVTLDIKNTELQDNYFHLAPGIAKHITLTSPLKTTILKGYLTALNLVSPIRIKLNTEI